MRTRNRKDPKKSSIAQGLSLATGVLSGPVGSSRQVTSPAMDGYTFQLDEVPSARPLRTPSPIPDYPPPPYLSSPSTGLSSRSSWASTTHSDSDSDIYVRTPSEDHASSHLPTHHGQRNITMRNVFNQYGNGPNSDSESKDTTRGRNASLQAPIAIPDLNALPGMMSGLGGLANTSGNAGKMATDAINVASNVTEAFGLAQGGVGEKPKKTSKKQKKAEGRRRRGSFSSSSSDFSLSDFFDSSDSDSSFMLDGDSSDSSSDDEEIKVLKKQLKKLEKKQDKAKSSSSKRSSGSVGSSTGVNRGVSVKTCSKCQMMTYQLPKSKFERYPSLWEAEQAKANAIRARFHGHLNTPPTSPPSYAEARPMTLTAGCNNTFGTASPSPYFPSLLPINPMSFMPPQSPMFGMPTTLYSPPKSKEKGKKKKSTKVRS